MNPDDLLLTSENPVVNNKNNSLWNSELSNELGCQEADNQNSS